MPDGDAEKYQCLNKQKNCKQLTSEHYNILLGLHNTAFIYSFQLQNTSSNVDYGHHCE
jgi:hypothetical protein